MKIPVFPCIAPVMQLSLWCPKYTIFSSIPISIWQESEYSGSYYLLSFSRKFITLLYWWRTAVFKFTLCWTKVTSHISSCIRKRRILWKVYVSLVHGLFCLLTKSQCLFCGCLEGTDNLKCPLAQVPWPVVSCHLGGDAMSWALGLSTKLNGIFF